ncbi:MAG TPA: nucleotidyltransferase family protein [Candidatus Sulfotelmatobacter sp.]|nr:nucleotidyltransferase family protein [Candidatus Sulfotelmatobacter sp.]
MKAFLLAAGHGTRLRPITNTVPKCLVPIRGIPLLAIWLELCRKFGIDELLINIHAQAALVRDFLRENPNGIRAQVVEEEELLGSAGTLRHNRDWIAAEELFWVFYADVLCQPDLGEMLELHLRRRPTATLGVYEVPDPSRCGIVSTDADGTIQQFVEKPSVPVGNLAFAGVMIATPEIIEMIPHNRPADIGFHVLPRLIGRMQAYRISSYIIDIGTMENYQTAQRTWPGLS